LMWIVMMTLSILFMRFYTFKGEVVLDPFCAFNSLYEIRGWIHLDYLESV